MTPGSQPLASGIQVGDTAPEFVQDSSEAEILIARGSDIGVLAALLAALHHPDPLMRCDAASGLAALADELRPAQLRPLLQALGSLSQDPAAQVRLASVKALAEICSPQVLPYLRQALRDTDSDVVKAASQALEPYRGAKRQPPRSARPKQQRKRASQT
jgi:HEAT repeat protein